MTSRPLSTPAPATTTTRPGSQEPALSPDRAFVVHFYAAAAGREIEAGRVEHVRSGQTAHFHSWDDLAAFVAAVVGASTRSQGGTW